MIHLLHTIAAKSQAAAANVCPRGCLSIARCQAVDDCAAALTTLPSFSDPRNLTTDGRSNGTRAVSVGGEVDDYHAEAFAK